MINLLQQIVSYTVLLFSVTTAFGVLLHDTGVDKAVSSIVLKPMAGADLTTEAVSARSGSNLHPHAEHMNVKKDGREIAMQPRRRAKKDVAVKRVMRGYHGDGICMPLAGEWH